MRMKSLVAATCAALVCFSAAAQASITFSQAQLLAMTGPVPMTSPLYADGAFVVMRGDAGATLEIDPNTASYFSLSAGDLAGFNAAVGAGNTLEQLAFNDNNQIWQLGIWYDLGAGKVEAFATLQGSQSNPTVPNSAGLSLLIPSAVVDAGVFVRSSTAAGSATSPDRYHASFAAVPEPMTLAVWGGLLGIGAFVGVRRQRASRG